MTINKGMDLQLFAEELEEDNNEENGNSESKETFTKEEFEAQLQAETDRRVTQALKKQERKLDEKLKEAEKLRQMSEEDKKKYQLEQREKQLTQKEREYALMENKIECSNILADRGLPKEFLDYVVAEDAEQMMENIKTMDKVFKSAVADAVNDKIEKKSPTHSADIQSGMTKEKFKKLTVSQQSEIYKNNPELWRQMTK